MSEHPWRDDGRATSAAPPEERRTSPLAFKAALLPAVLCRTSLPTVGSSLSDPPLPSPQRFNPHSFFTSGIVLVVVSAMPTLRRSTGFDGRAGYDLCLWHCGYNS